MTEQECQAVLHATLVRRYEAEAVRAETEARKAAVELETAELVRAHVRAASRAADLPPWRGGAS